MNMKPYTFTAYLSGLPHFDLDLLPAVAKEHNCSYHMDFGEGTTVTFKSGSLDCLEEGRDKVEEAMFSMNSTAISPTRT